MYSGSVWALAVLNSIQRRTKAVSDFMFIVLYLQAIGDTEKDFRYAFSRTAYQNLTNTVVVSW